jgi:uncharacterized protein YndB with AHSA1/START domain
MTTFMASATISINSSREKVWDALTIPEQVKKYFFGTNLVTTWEVGSPIFFRGEWEGKAYEDKGTVLSFTPPKSLSYDYWSPFGGMEDKKELYQILSYELAETPEGVQVTISQSNVDTQERADHSSGNWHKVLEALKTFVESAQA